MNETQAFFSTAFGIVEFNPSNYNFGVTILTGVGINQITSAGTQLYAATGEGVYQINQSEELIIADFTKWNLLGPESGLPDLYNATSITWHKNSIYIGADRTLYKSLPDQSSWSNIYTDPSLDLAFLNNSEDRLITG